MHLTFRTTAALALGAWLGTATASGQDALPPWADSALVSINQEPLWAPLDPLGPPEDPDRWRLSLDGEWHFLLFPRAADAPADPLASLEGDSRWSTIAVPGSWHQQGFAQPTLARNRDQNPVYDPERANPVGIYVREFTLPAGWEGRRVVLRLGRVRSSVTVHLNGRSVGYSENAESGAEFDLSRFLVAGTNRLTLTVTEWSTSSELLGAHWTRAGLLGGVELLSLAGVHLNDFLVVTRIDLASAVGTVDLRFWLRGLATSLRGAYRLQTELVEPDGRVVARRFRQGVHLDAAHQANASLRMRVPSVAAWSNETPNLYQLNVHLIDPSGRSIHRAETYIGFRTVELNRRGLHINARREVLRGVSIDPDLTTTVTSANAIDQHLNLMQQAGINAVRVPVTLDRAWYDRLDARGMYVLHDLRQPGVDRTPSVMDRAIATVEAAKNRPSTLAWVTPATDDYAELRNWLRRRTPSHTALPNRAVALVFKPRSWQLARRLERSDQALLLWPFGSVLGNSGGGLRRLWRQVEAAPTAVGGFLPRWAVSVLAGDGDGGDLDAIARGLVDARSRPLPALAEVAELYRRARFEVVDATAGIFRLTNRSTSGQAITATGRWTLRRDGSVIAAGRLPHLGVGSGQAIDFEVAGLPDRNAAAEYHLSLELEAAQGPLERSQPQVLARAQFPLPSTQSRVMNPRTGDAPGLSLVDRSARIELETRDVTFRIDRTTGTMRYLAYRGRPLIDGPILPGLWRMPTQIERANGLAEVDSRLRLVFDRPPADWVGRRVSGSSYSSVSEYTVLDEGVMRVQSTLHGTGTAELQLHWLGEPGTPDPPRLGLSIPLGPRVATVEWFGRGPGESYGNRIGGAEVGRWRQPVPFANPYYWRQAFGQRSEVRWLTVWFTDGAGLLVVTPPTSSFTISESGKDRVLELDAQHRGVGGERDDAVLERPARIPPGEYRATFLLLPLAAGSDPQDYFRVSAHTEEVAVALQSPVERPAWSLPHLGRKQPLNLIEANADTPPTRRSVLNDGWIGSVDAYDGSWVRLESLPAEITIDLERVETVRRVRLGILASTAACADLPPAVEFSYSTDRRRWVSLEPVSAARALTATAPERRRLWFSRDLLGRPVRWLRARVLDPEATCTDGTASHVLVDELVVE